MKICSKFCIIKLLFSNFFFVKSFSLHSVANTLLPYTVKSQADNNYMGGGSMILEEAVWMVTEKTEGVINWMQSSGLKINESKTEVCIFHRSNSNIINITINNSQISTTNTMNILGILFDSQLKWNQQYSKATKEANSNINL